MDENANISPLMVYGLLGFLVSWILVPLILKKSARAATEDQTRRFHQTHKASIPRFGGIALAAAFVVAAAVYGTGLGFEPLKHQDWVVIFGSLLMFGVGLWDDFRPLGAKIKLLAQIAIATAVYFSGIKISNFTDPITHTSLSFGYWSFLATVFWLVALTNLINLIDGIDGLAGGISFMLMCLLIYVGLQNQNFSFFMAIGMAGALLAFIYFNFPPAKIYMGDGGAYFLGFLIGILTINNSQKGTIAAALIAPVFALALPIVDVSLAILRRGLKGLPIFRPDRKHIHHRLVASGYSHRRTVLTLYAVSLLFSVMAFAIFWSQARHVPIMFGFLFLTLVVSARSLGFLQGWLTVGNVLGTAMQMRKESRYALCLSRWLEMEAERCESLHDLWASFVFMACKLGFIEVKLELENNSTLWRCREIPSPALALQRSRHELRLANMTALELAAASPAMSPKIFEHLSELAAEAWMKSVLRWQTVNDCPAHFDSESTAEETLAVSLKKDLSLPA